MNVVSILSYCLTLISTFVIACTLVQAQAPVASWPFTGNANDVSGNGHNGAVTGATLVDDRFGVANRAYVFNGTSDDITVAGHSDFRFGAGTEFTVSAWVKLCTAQANPVYPFIVGTASVASIPQDPSNQGWALHLCTHASDGLSDAGAWRGTKVNGDYLGVGGGSSLADGQWHHVAVTSQRLTWEGVTPGVWQMIYRLYVDGNVVSTVSDYAGGHYDFSADNTPLMIARDPLYSTRFKGAVDDIKIYHSALSSTQIGALYGENGWPSASAPNVAINRAVPTTICSGDNVQLNATGAGAISRYRWLPPDGLSDPTSRTPTAQPTSTTTYRVQAISSEPCSRIVDDDTITIHVISTPRMALGSARYICAGESVQLGAPVTGGQAPFRFGWTPSIGLSSTTQQFPTANPSTSQRYIVTITDARGCIGRDTVLVTVLPIPRPQAGPDTLFCAGGPGVQLGTATGVVAGNPPFTFRWAPDAGLSDASIGRPVAKPDSTTRYIVEVTDVSGCIGRDTVVVRVAPTPVADAGEDARLCTGGSIVIGSTTFSGNSYRWSPSSGLNDPNAPMPVATPSTTTTYYLVVTNQSGCESRDSVVVAVDNPILEMADSNIDFGTLDGCESGRDRDVVIKNRGATLLRVTSADLSTTSFAMITTLPFELGPGEQRTIGIRFAPRVSGVSQDTLRLRGEPCMVGGDIALSGGRDASLVSVSSTSIDFGKQLDCSLPDSTVEIVVVNDGQNIATLRTAAIAQPFSIVPAQSVFPIDIPVGDSVVLRIRYSPVNAGSHQDDALIAYESGTCRDTLRVAVNGYVEEPSLDWNGGTIDFGSLTGCESGRDTAVVVNNPGRFDVQIDSVIIPTGFRSLTSFPLTINASTAASISFRYEPLGTGASSGDFELKFSPCSKTLRLPAAGSKQGVIFQLADSIDFGELVDCAASDATRKFSVGYFGQPQSVATISSVTITGPFKSSVRTGQSIADGEVVEFDVIFAPTAGGQASGYIDFVLEPCGVTRRIVLTGTKASVKLVSLDVDFGVQVVGATVARDVVVRNEGSAVATITEIAGVDLPFAMVSPSLQLPATLRPGDSLVVNVQFVATNGLSVDTLSVVATEPCSVSVSSELRGIGESSASAEIALPNMIVAVGDHISVPLFLSSWNGLTQSNALEFEAIVSFDRTLLVPTNQIGVTADSVLRHVRIVGTRSASDTLAVIEMTATLGLAESTVLNIESFRWTTGDEVIATSLRNGEVRISGICRSGGARLFDGRGEVMLKPAVPNPALSVTAIEYELNEVGPTRLFVVDALGRHALTLVEDVLAEGTYVSWLDVRDLASGSYVVVLRTPTLTLAEHLEVRK